MIFGVSKAQNFEVNKLRRKDLLGSIKERYKVKEGYVVLFANFESDRVSFRQDSSFYYYTAITEPGVVLVADLQGRSVLYIPNCGTERAKWVSESLSTTAETAKKIGVDEIKYLGDLCLGYQIHPFFAEKEYATFIEFLKRAIKENIPLFSLNPDTPNQYIDQRLILERLNQYIPELKHTIHDISDIVAKFRRKKDMDEIERLYKAVEVTVLAQEAATQAIADKTTEHEVQASLEYMFTGSGAKPAFPSIVASGKNGTILHYNQNSGICKNGELVVVDIGADLDYYCADLTRTYPVSGSFTPRQKELYNIVLDTQEYVAERAKPGMWLFNKENPEKSLHHLAVKYLEKRGYAQYFTHGIGHFLGLDVHDVGDKNQPLQEGDVFTIEPGIYIPEEGIGIRIEDNYWMVKNMLSV